MPINHRSCLPTRNIYPHCFTLLGTMSLSVIKRYRSRAFRYRDQERNTRMSQEILVDWMDPSWANFHTTFSPAIGARFVEQIVQVSLITVITTVQTAYQPPIVCEIKWSRFFVGSDDRFNASRGYARGVMVKW